MPTEAEMRERNILSNGIGASPEFVGVTPSDTENLPLGAPRAIFVGVAGDVALTDMMGNTSTLVSAGAQYHPIRPARVRATGTTATNILALY